MTSLQNQREGRTILSVTSLQNQREGSTKTKNLRIIKNYHTLAMDTEWTSDSVGRRKVIVLQTGWQALHDANTATV